MRILLLNQTFHPDVAATAQQTSDLAVKLVERGHDVTVVCGRRAYDGTDKYPRKEVWRGVHIRRIASLQLGKTTRWRRAANFGSFLVNCMVYLAGLPRFELVVACTSPPLISWIGALFVHIKGGRFVFWVMDLNPDEALAAGWLRPDSWTTRRLKAMLHYGLERAAMVLVLDRFMARRIEEKGVAPEKIVTLPPWSRDDVVRYDSDGREAFRSAHGLNGRHVVMYSGNHSPCHPLSTLLEAARSLRADDDIAFCFVGGGSEFGSVRRFAEEHRLTNIVTVPYQPLDSLAASLSSADLHVVIVGDPFVGIVHPCKVYNIRTLGIPYLYIGPTASHVVDLGPTYAATHGDVEQVVRHIQSASATRRSTPLPYADSVFEQSRDYVLAKTILALEAAAFGSAPVLVSEPLAGAISQKPSG